MGELLDDTVGTLRIHADPWLSHSSASNFNGLRTSDFISSSASSISYDSAANPKTTSYNSILDSQHYIPAGCLRLERKDCQIGQLEWEHNREWKTLVHPRDIGEGLNTRFLDLILQNQLLQSEFLLPFQNLYQAKWIRLEFKARDSELGQIRVYILPDDVGNSRIDRHDRTLRRALQSLLSKLDFAGATWISKWSPVTPVQSIHRSLKSDDARDISLFNIFNTLPSPTPQPNVVEDLDARAAMDALLSGEIDGLNTKMMAYQQRSAAMMLQRESQPAKILDPRLRHIHDQDGVAWYCDPIAGTCLRNPRMFEAARGGICAETMGYGKTLICLSLILATRDFSSRIPVEYSVGSVPIRPKVGSLLDMAAATIGRTGTPWKRYFSDKLEHEGMEYEKCIEAIRKGIGYYYIPAPVPQRKTRNPITPPDRKLYLTTATIVVVPPNLVRQWQREIDKHTTGLKVLTVSKSRDKLPPALELREYDLILISKPRFEQEARDGCDNEGRRASDRGKCRGACSVTPKTQKISCVCYREDDIYRSPLRELHFKRLITDEGHSMGNSSKAAMTNAVVVIDFLQVSSRWIVSGTPTQGLYGADKTPYLDVTEPQEGLDVTSSSSELSPSDQSTGPSPQTQSPRSSSPGLQDTYRREVERKDLEKLGNIAVTYLKSRPWANSFGDNDYASWSQYVMPPRLGSKIDGHSFCLRDTLAGMIIRHRPEDLDKDVELPPLHQKVVYLEGSMQDKLSLNLFAMMINSNAVTSERKDADYLFHPRQKRPLADLVANLRQASFFWSGFTKKDLEFTRDVAQAFLTKDTIAVSDEDKNLLMQGIQTASSALASSVWCSASEHHEMSFYIENEWKESVRQAWAFDGIGKSPTLLGATQLRALDKYVRELRNGTLPSTLGLEDAGRAAIQAVKASSTTASTTRTKTDKIRKRLGGVLPELTGGVALGNDASPRKKQLALTDSQNLLNVSKGNGKEQTQSKGKQKLAQKESDQIAHISIADESLDSATIISTSSAKLSYLIDQVVKYHKDEKIIIFYENDNVAYYIAQALEAVNVEHLIYAKTLNSDTRSKYLVRFNNTPRFRCLLMDITQAAFGLDVSSASRVYFINPVLSKQIEAQAVKRAHRIGQFKPVYVETLVLRSSIEEMIVERRNIMSSEEQKKCKTVLDDQTMYEWIRNVRFVPLTESDAPGPDQVAKLARPLNVAKTATYDPHSRLFDSDLEEQSYAGRMKPSAQTQLPSSSNDTVSSTSHSDELPDDVHARLSNLRSTPMNEADGIDVQDDNRGDDEDGRANPGGFLFKKRKLT